MKKIILFVLLLLFIPLAQAVPPVTSYWGSVTLDGITQPNAAITVIDSSGTTVASATSDQNARYSVVVPWADSYTQSVSLTFKVNGKIATTITIGGMGDDINLNLSARSSSSGGTSGGSGGSSGGTYPTFTATAQATAVKTATPVVEKTEIPQATAQPQVTETTKVTAKPTSTPTTPGFGVIIGIFAIAMIASLLQNNKSRR